MSKELAKTYDPKEMEEKLYQKWVAKRYFHAEPDPARKPFTIVIPPPNITGQLHMGHALDNTIQDILIRFRRMQGYNALWQPGTDHASIATELRIREKLKEEGAHFQSHIDGSRHLFTPEKTDATMDLYDHLFRTVYDTPAGIPLDTLLRRSLTEWMAQQDEHTVKLADMDNGRDQMFISRYIYSADRPWYREMIRYDPTRYIPKIGVPVLALNGNRDVNVPSQENLASIRRLLAQGGNGNFKVVEMEGLNHMFQQAVTGTSSEAAQLEEVFSEEALPSGAVRASITR